MADSTRPGRGGTRRRIAGQRRTTDRRADGASEEATGAAPAEESSDVRIELRTTESQAETETETETEAEPPAELDSGLDTGPEAATARPFARLVAGVIGVLLVLTLAGGVVLGQQALRGHRAEQARSEASAAAREAAETVLSYDYRSLDQNFAASRALLTPEFAADFDQTTKVVTEQAKKVKATVRAEVREVGVRDGDADRVTLLVFVNQTTTSTITENKPRVDLNRARVTMARIDGQWLVRSIEPL
jgi:Mce-associated membrane protein